MSKPTTVKFSTKEGKSLFVKATKTGKKQTKDILDSSINELRFALLQILHLKIVLQEIEAMTTDTLVKGVIKNGLERHEMDKLIHTRNIFNK